MVSIIIPEWVVNLFFAMWFLSLFLESWRIRITRRTDQQQGRLMELLRFKHGEEKAREIYASWFTKNGGKDA